MQRLLPNIAAVGLVVAAGFFIGAKNDRWGQSEKLTRAAERLQHLPTQFGHWYSTASPISQDQLEGAEAVGHFSRRFVNRNSGAAVSVMLLCGRHGPIAVHPPTVCFTGAGWRLDGKPEKFTLKREGNTQVAFWTADFQRTRGGIAQRMRTFWGWSTDGNWDAAENPRFRYADSVHLYKLYVTVPLQDDAASPGNGTATAFMKEFLPRIRPILGGNQPKPQ